MLKDRVHRWRMNTLARNQRPLKPFLVKPESRSKTLEFLKNTKTSPGWELHKKRQEEKDKANKMRARGEKPPREEKLPWPGDPVWNPPRRELRQVSSKIMSISIPYNPMKDPNEADTREDGKKVGELDTIETLTDEAVREIMRGTGGMGPMLPLDKPNQKDWLNAPLGTGFGVEPEGKDPGKNVSIGERIPLKEEIEEEIEKEFAELSDAYRADYEKYGEEKIKEWAKYAIQGKPPPLPESLKNKDKGSQSGSSKGEGASTAQSGGGGAPNAAVGGGVGSGSAGPRGSTRDATPNTGAFASGGSTADTSSGASFAPRDGDPAPSSGPEAVDMQYEDPIWKIRHPGTHKTPVMHDNSEMFEPLHEPVKVIPPQPKPPPLEYEYKEFDGTPIHRRELSDVYWHDYHAFQGEYAAYQPFTLIKRYIDWKYTEQDPTEKGSWSWKWKDDKQRTLESLKDRQERNDETREALLDPLAELAAQVQKVRILWSQTLTKILGPNLREKLFGLAYNPNVETFHYENDGYTARIPYDWTQGLSPYEWDLKYNKENWPPSWEPELYFGQEIQVTDEELEKFENIIASDPLLRVPDKGSGNYPSREPDALLSVADSVEQAARDTVDAATKEVGSEIKKEGRELLDDIANEEIDRKKALGMEQEILDAERERLYSHPWLVRYMRIRYQRMAARERWEQHIAEQKAISLEYYNVEKESYPYFDWRREYLADLAKTKGKHIVAELQKHKVQLDKHREAVRAWEEKAEKIFSGLTHDDEMKRDMARIRERIEKGSDAKASDAQDAKLPAEELVTSPFFI